ncbi:MAG: hypothetical protein AB7E52_04510 [Bdellovibrionales bacterium]
MGDTILFFRFGGEISNPNVMNKLQILESHPTPYAGYKGTPNAITQHRKDGIFRPVSQTGIEICLPKGSPTNSVDLLSIVVKLPEDDNKAVRIPLCARAGRLGQGPISVSAISVLQNEDGSFAITPILQRRHEEIEFTHLYGLLYHRDGKLEPIKCDLTSKNDINAASAQVTVPVESDIWHIQLTHAATNIGEFPLGTLLTRVPYKKYGTPFVMKQVATSTP